MRIVEIAIVRIYGMKGHQSFEIDGSCPYIGFIFLVARWVRNRKERVGMKVEIMVVDLDNRFQYIFPRG